MDVINSPGFATHIKDLLNEHHAPGVSVGIYQDGKFGSAGFGLASVEPPLPCTPETLFDIASASKSITAASVALLVEDDENYPEVQWDAIMADLLPDDFVMPEEVYTKSVTLDDIMGHRSGMPRHDSSYMAVDNAETVTRNLRNLPVNAPLRTKYQYNNMMYTVATYLVEKKSGLSFPDFVQKHFFGPLGMTSSNIQPCTARAKGFGHRLASGHEWDDKAENYNQFPLYDDFAGVGAGSIITSVNDYVKYIAALLNQDKPFSKKVYESLIRPRTIADPGDKWLAPGCSPILYAAGWEVHWYRGHRIVMHDGSIIGLGSSHFFVPDAKFAGAVFCNSSSCEVTTIIASELIDEALNVPKSERPDWNAWEKRERPEDEGKKDENGETINSVDLIRRAFCPDSEESQLQEKPLDAYVGKYTNKGYHDMVVQIKDEKLFVDASDRSFGFELTLEHVCDQTKYIGHYAECLNGWEDGPLEGEPLKVKFEFDGERAVRLAVEIEEDLTEQEGYIWFDRT